jgi:hypothetical protein
VDMNIRNPVNISKNLLAILIVAFLARVIPLIFGTGNADDMMLYQNHAYPVLMNLNIYQVTHRLFPYPPLSMPIPALCMVFSDFFKIPFHIMMRIPAITADTFIAVSIYTVLSILKEKNAFWWSMLYALNPVSILISSFHGNIMPLPALLTLLAYAVLLFGIEKNLRLSALLLGLAVGLRGYPVLLLPVFLIRLQVSFKQKISYLLNCLLPILLSFVPFLILDYKSVLSETFGYNGAPDFGLFGFSRAMYFLLYKAPFYELFNELSMTISKFIFLISYFYILFFIWKKKLSIIYSIILIFLLFYFIYPGISCQYLIWLLPFAFLSRDRFLYIYLIFASAALVSFYLLYYPKMIFISKTIHFYSNPLFLFEAAAILGLWAVCGRWILLIVKAKDRELVLL